MHLFWFLSCIDDDGDDGKYDDAAAGGSTKVFEVLIGETSKVGISLVSAHRISEYISMSVPIDSESQVANRNKTSK